MRLKIIFFLYLITGCLFSQKISIDQKNISAVFGIGNNHLIDEYISKNEYTGISNSYGLNWSDRNDFRQIGVGLNFSTINNLENINNKAITYDFFIHYKYLYNIYSGSIFNKPITVFLGPDFGFYIHYRDQKVAETSQALSIASMFSANVVLSAVSKIGDNFSISGNFSLSILSFAARIPSIKNTNNIPTPIALLTTPSLIDINSSFIVNYYISNHIMLQLGYQLKFIQINKWDYFRLISDNLIMKCGVNF